MKVVKGKIRDEKYLDRVRQEGCLVCGYMPADPHHLLRAEERGIGLRNGDNWAVPLCRNHHDELHRFGREEVWWAVKGTDPVEWAKKNWSDYNDEETQEGV